MHLYNGTICGGFSLIQLWRIQHRLCGNDRGCKALWVDANVPARSSDVDLVKQRELRAFRVNAGQPESLFRNSWPACKVRVKSMTEAAERWSACSIATVAWPRTWRQPGDPRGGGDALAHTGRIPKQTLSGRDRERAGKLSPPATSSP